MIAAKIANLLKQKNRVAVVSHIMPDGDSVGSMLALYNVLTRMGKVVDVYSSDRVPEVYSFLPGYNFIKTCFENESDTTVEKYDVLAVLDCGSIDRTGCWDKISAGSEVTLNIDHHGTNLLFADLNLVDTNASATGELIYQIIKLMGEDILKDEAECLYTAILTDTGSFRYSNTTSITHQIAGDLINTGLDFGEIYDLIYKRFKFDDIKVLGKALSSIELFEGNRIAFMVILKKDLMGMSFDSINTTDFIDYARDIDSVEAAVFAKETGDKEFKLSFRSKRIVDVKSICERYGGGGHVRAAGCTIKGDLTSIKKCVIEELTASLEGDKV